MITLTPQEEAILRPEYEMYVASHERYRKYCDTTNNQRWKQPPAMSFDDWWRNAADEAKDRTKYQD